MVVNKRLKNTRQRGSKTHGYGSMKKHRGAGHRGGRGNAGSGKRGDVKKPTFQKLDKNYLGKKGFSSKNRLTITSINLSTIQQKLASYLSQGIVKDNKGMFELDISKLGYNKLLGSGNVSVKLEIKADYASPKAVEKVKKAGGKVEVLEVEEKPVQEAQASKKEVKSKSEEEPQEEVAEETTEETSEE